MNGGSSAAIHISNDHPVPLNRQIHSGCVADIFYGKKMEPRDIASDPYFSFLKDLNFTSLQYSGGANSHVDHVFIGDTTVYDGKGDGYNIREEDCTARGKDINSFLEGVGSVHFGKDFFNEYCALLNKLQIPGDIIANVETANIDELIWKIQRAHAQRVILGMETCTGSNDMYYPDGATYVSKITPWIKEIREKFPQVKIAIDAAPIWSSSQKFAAWNDQLSVMPADEVRLYLWDKDLENWTVDDQKNVDAMNDAFNNTIPQWLNMVKQKFPGKKVSVWQWGIKNKSPLEGTMLGSIYIARMNAFMINYNRQNDNYISFASFMSIKSLNRGDGRILNNYYGLKACAPLFSGNKQVDDLSITGMPGVNGVACEENGKFTVLLTNESGSSYNDVSAFIGKSLAQNKKFSITSVHASSLSSTDVSTDSTTSSGISLRPYSVNLIEF